MPVINITKADVLRSKVLPAQWYSWEIRGVEGPEKNAQGDGLNYVVIFSLIDQTADLNGKEIKRTFSSKALGMIVPLVAAARGIKMEQVPIEDFSFEFSELVGKKIDGLCKQDTYNGNLNNKVEEYAVYKSIAGTPTPF